MRESADEFLDGRAVLKEVRQSNYSLIVT